jgi:hypothetical protein
VYVPDNLPQIKALDLSNSVIEEEEVMGFDLCPNLTKLKINACSFPNGSIRLIGRYAPKLTHLYMNRNTLNYLMFLGTIRKLPNLEELDIGYCTQLNDNSLTHIAQKCKKLKVLRVSDHECIVPDSIRLLETI